MAHNPIEKRALAYKDKYAYRDFEQQQRREHWEKDFWASFRSFGTLYFRGFDGSHQHRHQWHTPAASEWGNEGFTPWNDNLEDQALKLWPKEDNRLERWLDQVQGDQVQVLTLDQVQGEGETRLRIAEHGLNPPLSFAVESPADCTSPQHPLEPVTLAAMDFYLVVNGWDRVAASSGVAGQQLDTDGLWQRSLASISFDMGGATWTSELGLAFIYIGFAGPPNAFIKYEKVLQGLFGKEIFPWPAEVGIGRIDKGKGAYVPCPCPVLSRNYSARKLHQLLGFSVIQKLYRSTRVRQIVHKKEDVAAIFVHTCPGT